MMNVYMPERQNPRLLGGGFDGGAEGNRTPDLLNAIQALSQLSYGPNSFGVGMPPAVFSSAAGGT